MRRTHLWRLATVTLTAAAALAQPPLTTIQDTLYQADGTRFNGLLIISWNTFEAGDLSDIVSQSLMVTVVDGNFFVKLVPTTNSTPPTYYTVTYNSGGKIQFQETWVVGAVDTTLRIRDVRASSAPPSSPLPPPSQIPIQESDVVGLTGDLTLRPVMGTGFSPGRAAMINASGGIDAVVGNPSDCVLVDGTSGPCGTGGGGVGATFSDAEVPGGTVNGANSTFTLANAPSPAASLELFRNGLEQSRSLDYMLTGATVQFLTGAIPQPGDTLLAWYRLPASGSSGGVPAPEIECSAPGSSTTSTNFTSLGSCAIPASVLETGDRIDIHFDLAHSGTAAGFEYQVLWGATALTDRVAAAGDAMIAGKGEAALYTGGAQLRAESWGTALAFGASVANATDNFAPGLTIGFLVKLAQATSDTVTLVNFTVVRYPAQ